MLKVFFRWSAFAAYWVVLFALPPALLWGPFGLAGGAAVGLAFLSLLRFSGLKPLLKRLRARPLPAAQAPVLRAMVEEHCRRLSLPTPALYVIETPALNIAVLGFSQRQSALVVTQGLLDKLPRRELSAVVARGLCRVWSKDLVGETWLARTLLFLQRLTQTKPGLTSLERDRLLLHRLVRQLFLYPISLPAAWLLHAKKEASALDQAAIRLTGDRRALTEAYRRMEAVAEHSALRVPFCTRHLFLVSPLTVDPLARVFFTQSGVEDRIRAMESFQASMVTP
ncbi:hypothetical protein K2X33_15805 [bacterium]|nr:hypothetical protein [bacterium]